MRGVSSVVSGLDRQNFFDLKCPLHALVANPIPVFRTQKKKKILYHLSWTHASRGLHTHPNRSHPDNRARSGSDRALAVIMHDICSNPDAGLLMQCSHLELHRDIFGISLPIKQGPNYCSDGEVARLIKIQHVNPHSNSVKGWHISNQHK